MLEHGCLFGEVASDESVGRGGRCGELVPVFQKALDALFGPCGYVRGELLIGVDFHAYNVLKRSLKNNEIDRMFTFFLHARYRNHTLCNSKTGHRRLVVAKESLHRLNMGSRRSIGNPVGSATMSWMKMNSNSAAFTPNRSPYHGPTDGRSRPAKSPLKTLSNGVLAAAYKVEIQGEENLPRDGQHVFAANHPGYLDPLLMAKVAGKTDLRFMAAIENFSHPVSAKVNEWAGAFPVNRKAPHPATIRHGEELFSEGASLGIFPAGQGQKPEDIGTLGTFKPGAALFALRGQADSLVGMAIHYEKSSPRTWSDRAQGLKKAAVVGAASAAAFAAGGPIGVAAVAATGALAGSGAGAKAGTSALNNPNPRPPFKALAGRVVGAVVGAVAGVAAATAAISALPAVAAVGVIGGAAAGGAYLWDHLAGTRDRASVSISKPISVPELGADERELVREMTEELHRSIGGELAKLSGIPYDENSPKMR